MERVGRNADGATPLMMALIAAVLLAAGCGNVIEVVTVEAVGEVRLTDWFSDDPERAPVPEEPAQIVDLGDQPYLVVFGDRCFSSSCTSLLFSECAIEGPDGSGHVTIRMRIAVEVREGGGLCTEDCAGYVAECGRVDITHRTMTFGSPDGERHTLTFPRTLGVVESSE